MINEKMKEYGNNRSVIRDLFEFGLQRKAVVGPENVFDFSLGNPNVPAPAKVKETLLELLNTKDDVYLHGYTSAQGDAACRQAIVDDLNKRMGTSFVKENLYMTCGAAASLAITFNAILNKGDEVIVFAPFFPEYKVFVEKAGGIIDIVKSNKDFQIDFVDLDKHINNNTKIVIINSPNNPTGVIYSEENIIKLAKLLEEKSKLYNHPIYLVSDEPYRELIYTDIKYPFITRYYKNSIVCYSFSKSLSLPGERIGYVLLAKDMDNKENVFNAVCGAGRSLGYVCAPALFQQMVPYCLGYTSDLNEYKKNLKDLKEMLETIGYEVVKPEGAFYMFVKALEEDANNFSENAKKFNLLLVPSDSFGVKGYVRIAYCVSNKQIKASKAAFENLYKFYQEEE